MANKRKEEGVWTLRRLMDELRAKDTQSFYNYLRMEFAMFDELVQTAGPRIEKILPRLRSECEE